MLPPKKSRLNTTRKKDVSPSKKKDRYRTRNWKEYNQSLINRGSITFWFDENSIQKWYSIERTGKPGRPNTYSDDAIRCGLMIRAVFRVALRFLQGFVSSILRIPMRMLLKPGEKLNVIFDSTGVKVFGEGEWKVRKYGYSKRRTWCKVHVGMCADTGQVVVSGMSSSNVSDEEAMIGMMGALEGTPLGDVLGDGAYDTVDCREAIHDLGGRQIIPPDKNAKLQKRHPIECLVERDRVI